jgi:hypothetical protein
VFIKREDGNMTCCTTVDDCLFVTSNDETWIQKQIKFLKAKYEDVSVEMGMKLDSLECKSRWTELIRE